MKKIILITMLYLAMLPITKAQITITQADFPLTSLTSTSLRDTSSIISPGNAGANQTWNFASFTSGTTQSYTQDFSVNNANPDFPSANSTPCVLNGPLEICAYYEINANGMYQHGGTIIMNVPPPNHFNGKVTYTPPVPEYSFPFTYNSIDSVGYLQEQINAYNPPQNGADSVLIRSHNTRKVEADGWGTVITPFGSYNALRLKITETEIDTQWVHVPGTGWQVEYEHGMSGPFVSYKWVTNGNAAVVATLSVDGQSVWRYNFLTEGNVSPQIPAAPTNLTTTVFKTQDVNIRIEWTDNANNEDGFKVERSEDGTNFTEVADLAANTVQYEDIQLSESTTYYYRVLAYNTNGSSAFSNVAQATTGISTGINEKISTINVYPNPASAYLMIDFKGKEANGAKLNLMNAMGQTIKEISIDAATTNIDLNNISSGYYFYQIINQQEILQSGKLIKH
jgi:hypothetical protein